MDSSPNTNTEPDEHESGPKVTQAVFVSNNKNLPHTKRGLIALGALLLLFAAAFAIYATKPADAPSPAKSAISGDSSGIIIKNTAIRERIYDLAPTFAAAGGHFVMGSTSNDEIIYDGKQIYNNKDLCGDCVVLSKNGQHYAFLTNNAKNQAILNIDNKRVATLSNNTQLIAVSNDGKSYMYHAPANTDGTGDTLYLNDKKLYSAVEGFYAIQTNGDLSKYLAVDCMAAAAKECAQYSIVLSGKRVFTSSKFSNRTPDTSLDQSWLETIALSDNGNHYSYFTPSIRTGSGGILYIDGRVSPVKGNGGTYASSTTGDVSSLKITDGGAVAFIDGEGVYVYTPAEVYASGEPIIYPITGNTQAFINDDASQVLLNYQIKNTNIDVSNFNVWVLNGKTLNEPERTNHATFSGITVYLYNFN
jgi:hypothetical protein